MLNYKILIVNLKRREDRKNNIINLLNNHNINNYFFYEAVDGNNIPLNLEIKNIFTNNDFYNRCGIIGCALSHYNIWLDLIKDKDNDYYIVLEDDITLDNSFNEKLQIVKNKIHNDIKNIDLLFLGFHKNENMNLYFNIDNYFTFIPFDINLYWIGGTFGYIVTKTGATNLINYIEQNNITHGIDYQMKLIDNSRLLMCRPSIVFSDWVQTNESNIDSDIQTNPKSFNFNSIIDYHNYLFIKEHDQFNNDIAFDNPHILDNVMKKCNDLNELAEGFNTFGFIKSRITKLENMDIMKNTNHGIYVKLDKTYRIKMICDWCDSNSLCNEFNIMSQNNFSWNNIKIVSDDECIDYYVIINRPPPYPTHFVPEKTIIFQMEPSIGTNKWNEWSNPDQDTFLQVNTHNNNLNNCAWQINYSYQFLSNTNKITKLFNRCLSSICSDKYNDIGHIKRIDFLNFLESKTDKNFELHVYGSVNNLHKFNNDMGSLKMKDKQNGISPYKYYFMFENNFEKNYISEKLWEPILCETLCFYYGAPNVTTYINSEAFVLLDINDFEKSYKIIETAISENWWSKKINIIKEEKYKILNYYNFFGSVE
jgi:GR25 family glycosyltransferase involved in LPS biosynthesis